MSAVQIRERALCVLERAAITGINTSFNKSKQRGQQVQILKQGAATIGGQLSRSGLPADDTILRAGKAVQAQLASLHAAASAGKNAQHEAVQRGDRKVPASLQLDPLSGRFGPLWRSGAATRRPFRLAYLHGDLGMCGLPGTQTVVTAEPNGRTEG